MPLYCELPGLVPSGIETDALTDFSDMLPTFVELGGGTVPENLVIDGTSIAPLILGKEKDRRAQVDYGAWARWCQTGCDGGARGA